MRLSLEQLRSRVFPSREEAVKELKRNGFAESGETYELGEGSPGKWHVLDKSRPTLAQWKGKTWTSQVAAVAALQRAGVPLQGGDYALGEEKPGVWRLLDRRDDVAQAAPAKPADQPAPKPVADRQTRSKATVVLETRKAAKPEPARKPPAPAKAPAKTAAKPPAKAPAKAAAPASPPARKPAAPGKSKSSDPDPAELPRGFDDWAFEQGTRPEGVLRVDLQKKAGVERRWQNYLRELAAKRGHQFAMKRDGRFTRFLLTKKPN